MKIDKIKNYIFEIILCITLLFTLFVPDLISRFVLAIILIFYAIIIGKNLKKRNEKSIYSKQVTYFMFGFAVIFLIIFYIMGLYFGYYKAVYRFSVWSIFNNILPLAMIIVSSEIIRSIFLAQKNRVSATLVTIAMILIEFFIYGKVYDIGEFEVFLSFIGTSVFSAISANLLYNYISTRYGYKPVIVYRLITILYVYVIPIIPDIYTFLSSFIKMIYPYFIYAMLEQTFSRNQMISVYKSKKKNIIFTVGITIIMLGLVMLISCQFRYGTLVIGSWSMAPTLNKGDIIIYEQYKYGTYDIEEKEIIVFDNMGIKTVHRLEEIKSVNGLNRYYTKGDNNMLLDDGYLKENQIIGKVKFKIPYIGYPSLWISKLFGEG